MAVASPPHRRRHGGGGGIMSPSMRKVASGGLVLLVGFWVGSYFLLSFVGGHSTAGASEGSPQALTQLLSDPRCAAYADAIQAAADGASTRNIPLQLSQAQMLWVATLVQGQAALRGRPARQLVFGYDWHSDALQAANCQGRTVFLESSLEQIDRVKGVHPFLEVHIVHYRGKHEEENAFFSSPWLMDVPAEVRNDDCYDVILVDTTASQDPIGVNRMESSYFAIQNARRCVMQGKLGDVVLLLHDAQRPLEQRIIREMLLAPDPSGLTSTRSLGTVKDAQLGDLAAFRVTAGSGAVDAEKRRSSARRLFKSRKHSRKLEAMRPSL